MANYPHIFKERKPRNYFIGPSYFLFQVTVTLQNGTGIPHVISYSHTFNNSRIQIHCQEMLSGKWKVIQIFSGRGHLMVNV